MRLEAFFHEKFGFASGLFPGKAAELEYDISAARMRCSADEWLSLCLGLSLACGLALLPTALFWEWGPLSSIAAFACVFIALARYPASRAGRIGRRVEKELPSALRAVAIELSANRAFEDCLEGAGRMGGVAGADFRRVLKAIDGGASPQDAIASWARRTRSTFASRAAGLLILAYRKGAGTAEGLRALAAEISAVERARMKEYGGKLSMWSLLFIALSAVMPAIAQMFLTIGPVFLHFSVTPLQAFLLPAVVFPSVCGLMIIVAHVKRP